MLTSTVPTDHVLPGYRQDVITVLDQLEPFTTESVSIHQRPSVISLAIDDTCLPPRWGLLLRLNELQKSAESGRWPAADWPSDGAFTDARAFIEMLPPSSIPLPHLGLADDGEINFLSVSTSTLVSMAPVHFPISREVRTTKNSMTMTSLPPTGYRMFS